MYFIWYIIIGIIAGFVAGKLMRGEVSVSLLIYWLVLLVVSGRLGIQFVWYCSNWYYWQSCYLYCGSYIIVVDCFFAQEV